MAGVDARGVSVSAFAERKTVGRQCDEKPPAQRLSKSRLSLRERISPFRWTFRSAEDNGGVKPAAGPDRRRLAHAF